MWVASLAFDFQKALGDLRIASTTYVDRCLHAKADVSRPDGMHINVSVGGDTFEIVYREGDDNAVNGSHAVKVEGGKVFLCLKSGEGCLEVDDFRMWEDNFRRKDDLAYVRKGKREEIAIVSDVVPHVKASKTFVEEEGFDDRMQRAVASSLSGNEETINVIKLLIKEKADELGIATDDSVAEVERGIYDELWNNYTRKEDFDDFVKEKDDFRRKGDLNFDNGTTKGMLALLSDVGDLAAAVSSNNTQLSDRIEEVRKEVIGDPLCGLPLEDPTIIYRPGVVVNGTATVGGKDVNFSVSSNNTLTIGDADYYIKVDGGRVVVCPSGGGDCLPAKDVVVFSYSGKYATKEYVDSAVGSLEGGIVEKLKTFVEKATFEESVKTTVSNALSEDGGLRDVIETTIKDKVDGMEDLATKDDIYDKGEDGKYADAKYVSKADYDDDKKSFFTTDDYSFAKRLEDHTPGDGESKSTIYGADAIREMFAELEKYIV